MTTMIAAASTLAADAAAYAARAADAATVAAARLRQRDLILSLMETAK